MQRQLRKPQLCQQRLGALAGTGKPEQGFLQQANGDGVFAHGSDNPASRVAGASNLSDQKRGSVALSIIACYPAQCGKEQAVMVAGRQSPGSGSEDLPQDDGLVAVGTGGDDVDGGAHQLLDPLDVGLRSSRQPFDGLDAQRGFAPAGHFFVDRLQSGVAVGIAGGFDQVALVVAVAHADADRIQTVEHIQLGQAQTADTVDLDRPTQDHRIEPAAATRTSGGGAELVTAGSQALADIVEQLGGESTGADTGGVGLGDTQHVIQVQRADTGTGGGTAGGSVGAGDVGIGTVVDVQQRALGTLEHDIGTLAAQLVQTGSHVDYQGLQPVGKGQRLFQGLLEVDRLDLVIVLQHEVVVIQYLAELGGKALAMEQVTDAQAAAGYLVLVGRTDTTTGGADLGFAAGVLAGLIQRHVVGQDQRTGGAEAQAVAYRHATGFQPAHFLDQRFREQHHTVADVANDIFAQDPRGDQVQHCLFAIDHQGVAGLVTALIAHDGGYLIGQQIDDLALALITPLGAQDDNILTHVQLLPHSIWIGPGARKSNLQFVNLPAVVCKTQYAITSQLRCIGIHLPRQRRDHPLARLPQLCHLLLQPRLLAMGCPDAAIAAAICLNLTACHQQAQVGGKTRCRARPTEVPADLVVPATLGDALAGSRYEGRKGHPGVVVIATQLGQVEIQRHLRIASPQYPGNLRQLIQGDHDALRCTLEQDMGALQHLGIPGQVHQTTEHGRQLRLGDVRGQLTHFIPGLALQCIEQRPLGSLVQLGGLHQSAVDADMAQIQMHILYPAGCEGFQHQRDDFDVAGAGGVAVEFRTQLNQAARGGQRSRQRVQDTAAIA